MGVLTLENVACDFCHSDRFETEVEGIDWEFGIEEKFVIVRCVNCGLVQLNPRPTKECTSAIYPGDYGFHQAGIPLEPPKRSIFVRGLRRLMHSVKRSKPPSAESPVYPYLANFDPGSLLDVGCAAGFSIHPYGSSGSLFDLKNKGWEVQGCDINQEAAETGRQNQLDIRVGTISEMTFSKAGFDFIRFNHVLEHSPSPMNDLAVARDLLKAGGRLIISGPNIRSGAFILFGKYWSGLDVPRHFYHFSPEILKKYCNVLGFVVEREYFDSIPGDLAHTMRHFLQSHHVLGSTLPCTQIDLLDRFDFSLLEKGLEPIVEFLDERRLGDSYTLIAVRT